MEEGTRGTFFPHSSGHSAVMGSRMLSVLGLLSWMRNKLLSLSSKSSKLQGHTVPHLRVSLPSVEPAGNGSKRHVEFN